MADDDLDLPGDAEDGDEPIPNASDPKRSETIKQRQRREAAESKQFWEAVFDSDVGRREMWAILTQCGAFANSFGVAANGSACLEGSFYLSGRKSIGLELYRKFMLQDRIGVGKMHDECDPEFPKPKKGAR